MALPRLCPSCTGPTATQKLSPFALRSSNKSWIMSHRWQKEASASKVNMEDSWLCTIDMVDKFIDRQNDERGATSYSKSKRWEAKSRSKWKQTKEYFGWAEILQNITSDAVAFAYNHETGLDLLSSSVAKGRVFWPGPQLQQLDTAG